MGETSLREKYRGTLLGLAVGDALGMPTESKTRQEIRELFGEVRDYQKGYLPAGSYTDDTQQTIILAESLIRNSGMNSEDYIRQLIKDIDPGLGIGPNLYNFIIASRAAKEPCIGILAPMYPSNGLAMKISPVSLFSYKKPERVNETVEKLSAITHRHTGSLAGAVAIAHGILYALSHSSETFSKEEFLRYVSGEARRYDSTMEQLLLDTGIIDNPEIADDMCANSYSTVSLSIHTFAGNPEGFEEGIISLINSGGDTDTKASMFGALAGAFNGIQGIPPRWIEGLESGKENGKEKRDYLVELADGLYRKNT